MMPQKPRHFIVIQGSYATGPVPKMYASRDPRWKQVLAEIVSMINHRPREVDLNEVNALLVLKPDPQDKITFVSRAESNQTPISEALLQAYTGRHQKVQSMSYYEKQVTDAPLNPEVLKVLTLLTDTWDPKRTHRNVIVIANPDFVAAAIWASQRGFDCYESVTGTWLNRI